MVELNYYFQAIDATLKHSVIQHYVCGAGIMPLLDKAERRLAQLDEAGYLTDSEYAELCTRIIEYRRKYSVV